MKAIPIFRRSLIIPLFLFWLGLLPYNEAIIRGQSIGKVPKYSLVEKDHGVVNKVRFTQKGYIQFLKYITDVPTIRDYTFCIWFNSHNLTYSHPLLSYSKHEEERLIRVWISPHGSHINLEILGEEIFKEPILVREHQWYHICQSWSSLQAAWNLYFNGKLKSNGFVPKLRGLPIKSGGDIVVGQEYTDFDKGLDDGIEGDVSGFNFVLSSTSPSVKFKHTNHKFIKRHFEPNAFAIDNNNNNNKFQAHYQNKPIYVPFDHAATSQVEISTTVPQVLSYFNVAPNRESKGLFDFGKSFFNSLFDFWETPPAPPYHGYRHSFGPKKNSVVRTTNDVFENHYQKPLGLKLVELSHNCALGKGAPLSGKGVLISWTKTPVRVFGGAILKSVRPFCTHS